MYRAKMLSWNFSVTHGIAWKREFRVVNFCPVNENNNLRILLLHTKPCLEVKILSYLLHYTENDNCYI